MPQQHVHRWPLLALAEHACSRGLLDRSRHWLVDAQISSLTVHKRCNLLNRLYRSSTAELKWQDNSGKAPGDDHERRLWDRSCYFWWIWMARVQSRAWGRYTEPGLVNAVAMAIG